MTVNQLFIELIKYYQQLEALLIAEDWAEHTKANTKTFYKEKIEDLRKQCHEADPKRLQEIDTNRANSCRVVETEQII